MEYVDLVRKASDDKPIETQAVEAAKILKLKLDAKLQVLEAQMIEKNAEISETSRAVIAAKGLLTKNIDEYVTGILNAQDKAETLQRELDELEDLEKDLIEIKKLFD
jgi:hypothetical protein